EGIITGGHGNETGGKSGDASQRSRCAERHHFRLEPLATDMAHPYHSKVLSAGYHPLRRVSDGGNEDSSGGVGRTAHRAAKAVRGSGLRAAGSDRDGVTAPVRPLRPSD